MNNNDEIMKKAGIGLRNERIRQALEQARQDSLEQIKYWLKSKPRKQSNIAFTAGNLRDLAYLIEESETKARQDEKEQSKKSGGGLNGI